MFIELAVFVLMGCWCLYTKRLMHTVVAASSLSFFIIDWLLLPKTIIGQDPAYWALFWAGCYLALFLVLTYKLKAPLFDHKLLYSGMMLIVLINSFYGLSWYRAQHLYDILDPMVLPVVNAGLVMQIVGFFTGGRYVRNGDGDNRTINDGSVRDSTFSAYTAHVRRVERV